MTKTSRASTTGTGESFHKHYAAIWGPERWEQTLYPALARPTRYTALVNRFRHEDDFWGAIDAANIPRTDLRSLALPSLESDDDKSSSKITCYVRDNDADLDSPFPPPDPTTNIPQTHWNLDGASILVAHLLDPHPGDKVLDVCAAPGGKSIALSQSLFATHHATSASPSPFPPSPSLLHSNELDASRNKRLTHNLHTYLPSTLHSPTNLLITRLDATKPKPGPLTSLRPQTYNRVLIDAPCSSERHIIHAHVQAQASKRTAPEMANWKASSSKALAKLQAGILMAGLRAAKVGGRIVYATCSVEMGENDGVVERVLGMVGKERRKMGGGQGWGVRMGFGEGEEEVWAKVKGRLDSFGEKTRFGWIVLPDHPSGGRWGPLYFCVMTKVEGEGDEDGGGKE